MENPRISLLKFQLGPVQDFIAQARSTRDLWSASYLLSFLVAQGIKKVLEYNGTILFPSTALQPLLQVDWRDVKLDKLLIPNLPNVFVASFHCDTESALPIAKEVEKQVLSTWQDIVDNVYTKLLTFGVLNSDHQNAYYSQANHHFSITWNLTELSPDYKLAYQQCSKELDALKQTRKFHSLLQGEWKCSTDKDSLTGLHDSLRSDKLWPETIVNGEYKNLFKHDDAVSAITLIKRTWYLAYLRDVAKISGIERYKIKSTPEIASGKEVETVPDDSNKYIAAIAFDGDSIGQWVSGSVLKAEENLEVFHAAFSKALSDFALNQVHKIVNQHSGQLIYAGGDDVLALTPADTAVACAVALKTAFCEATKVIIDKNNETPTASAGIAIAHCNAPLQDLIKAARSAEKQAKNLIGRPSLFLTLMKRSGEINHWGCKWDSGGVALYQDLLQRIKNKKISARFPHKICEVLQVYLTPQRYEKPLLRDVIDTSADELIVKEISHIITRQSTKEFVEKNHKEIEPLIILYLNQLNSLQAKLTAIINLAQCVAFAARNEHEIQAQIKQPIPTL